jgi:hypothetical protein
MLRPSIIWFTWLIVGMATTAAPGADRDYFENHIRPMLVKHCLKCHGPKKQEAGFRMDSRAMLMRGGDSGAVIVPKKPAESLLIKYVRHDGEIKMPPDKKLDGQQFAALVEWIEMGAPWPKEFQFESSGVKIRSGPITKQERAFWSYQPLQDPAPPKVDNSAWMKSDIDRFVLAKLTEANLKPMRPAAARTLMRRATFDLTGLPPAPQETEAFEHASIRHPKTAFRNLIERLLASSAYGERWGRHWLDVVRYADTAGDTADYPVREAYLYRNWVISAFNDDKPYDQFIREQLAGDIIAGRSIDLPRGQYEQLMTATGFIAISRRFGFDVENYHHLTIQDTIDTLGQSVLGLSLGCARCHDHKYDPVNTDDYYAWYGIFESTKYSFPGSEQKKRPYDLFPGVPHKEAQRLKSGHDSALAKLDAEIKALEGRKKAQASESKEKFAETDQRLEQLRAQQLAMKKAGAYRLIYGAMEGDGHDAQVRIRGERQRLGERVPRKNLEILGNDMLRANEKGSGRLQLADWLTRPENPLPARVMVNRIWQHHFGDGLVSTENDFGVRGEQPSHPELFDWLASRFVESGWSIKAMHRLIMQSATYRLSSDFDQGAFETDPSARLRWRFNRRRLSAEEIRDSMLMISDDLDSSRGGAHPFPAVDTWSFTQHTPYYGNYATNRRSIYVMQQRLKRHPFLSLFDGADPNVSTAKRTLTTVPIQALYLMNNDFVHARSKSFAAHLLAAANSTEEKLDFTYRTILSRLPTREEISNDMQFLSAYRQQLQATDTLKNGYDEAAWAGLIRTMFVRNEFLFVD